MNPITKILLPCAAVASFALALSLRLSSNPESAPKTEPSKVPYRLVVSEAQHGRDQALRAFDLGCRIGAARMDPAQARAEFAVILDRYVSDVESIEKDSK